jgi:hypothetical protein
MISSTTVIRVTVGGEVVVSDPPSVLSFNESNDTQDNLSSFSNKSLETTRDLVSDPGGCFVVTSECDHYHQRTILLCCELPRSCGAIHPPEDFTRLLPTTCFPRGTTLGSCFCQVYSIHLSPHTVCLHCSQSSNNLQLCEECKKKTSKK